MEKHFNLPHHTQPHDPTYSPVFISEPIDCDVSILDQENPNPRDLVELYLTLHDFSTDEKGFNKQWNTRIAEITYCIQKIINRCDELSRPAYELAIAAGIRVTWPHFILRMYFAYVRNKRANLYLQKTKLKLQLSANRESQIVAHIEIAKQATLTATETKEANALALKLEKIKLESEQKKLIAENNLAITSYRSAIEERIAENRLPDPTNDLINKYNSLLESGQHSLDPQKWKKMEFIKIPKTRK